MSQLERATQHLVELVLDVDESGRPVCREATIRSPAASSGLRWAQFGPGVLLVDDTDGLPRPPAAAGVIGSIPHIDVETFARRYVGWWHSATGTRLPKRRRGLTPAVLAEALAVYRDKASYRRVSEAQGWYDSAERPDRARARRAIEAAKEDGLISAEEHAELRAKAPRGRPRKSSRV
ncbi:MAG TPA: hypothetical protein VF155_00690 [Candidatus Dormibacteraeota bacterium]